MDLLCLSPTEKRHKAVKIKIKMKIFQINIASIDDLILNMKILTKLTLKWKIIR